jgi:DNA-binding response OmpR family regulator
MENIHVLLVEDDPKWQRELVKEIRSACPERPVHAIAPDGTSTSHEPKSPGLRSGGPIRVHMAETFDQGDQLLAGTTRWDLLITDIGLTEPPEDMDGIRIARQAQEKTIPYLVVSGSRIVDTDVVRDLLLDYGAYDYFNKRKFQEKRFHNHVRNILFPAALLPAPQPERHSLTREITIGFGEEAFVLRADGTDSYIPKKTTSLFACFVRKVAKDAPGEGVDLSELNDAVGNSDSPGVASIRLRKAISSLNEHIRKAFGKLPNDESWIQSARGSGYALNTHQVRWLLDKERLNGLRRSSQSVYPILIDPNTLQANTSDDSDR